MARYALLLVTLAALPGCSFGMSVAPSNPAERTQQAARDCTASPWFPVLDTASAGVGVYNTVVSTSADDKVVLYGGEMDKSVGLVLGLTQLVVYGGAAVYGYVQMARCQTLRSEQNIDGAATGARPVTRGGVVVRAKDPEGEREPTFASELPSWSAFRRHPLGKDSSGSSRTADPP